MAFPSRRLKAFIRQMKPLTKTLEVSEYLDAKAWAESFEGGDAPANSRLTPKRRREIESMALAAMSDERAKISLRVPKRDLARLKSRPVG
jgi:hypothetical protein